MTFEKPDESNKEKDSEESKKTSEEVDDEKEILMGLKALERIKKMKGKDLSSFMQGQKEYAEKKLGEEDIKNMEGSEEAKELSEALDRLEQIKESKKIKKEKSKEKQEAEKTKSCAKCGAENMMDANFCGKCGNKYEKEREKNESEKKITCPKCGSKIDADSRFCGKCGEKLRDISQEKSPIKTMIPDKFITEKDGKPAISVKDFLRMNKTMDIEEIATALENSSKKEAGSEKDLVGHKKTQDESVQKESFEKKKEEQDKIDEIRKRIKEI